jgi:hypothetical protein
VTRVAAIDCGTNSIRLLVADLDVEASTLTDVERRMEIVRLGQDVDRTGRLAPEALARTFAACDSYAEVVRRTGAERVRFVATSASRDVENRDEFVAGVRDRLGVDPEVVTGAEEAALSFTGATRELAGSELDRPFLVVDIGGGSTELVLGDPGAEPMGGGLGRRRLRAAHRAPPARRPALTRARGDGSCRRRGGRAAGRRDGAPGPGAHSRRPGRHGDDGRGHGPRPTGVPARTHSPRAHPRR